VLIYKKEGISTLGCMNWGIDLLLNVDRGVGGGVDDSIAILRCQHEFINWARRKRLTVL
jgi:hypothetical protein